MPAIRRRFLHAVKRALEATLILALLGCGSDAAKEAETGGSAQQGQDPTGQSDVVLVVLDNVRADHTSICGYDRPTTPVLEELVANGARYTCRAYAPGAWTLPSHASFFTGVHVPEHGAHNSMKSPAMFDWGAYAHPLDDRLPTLAEEMKDLGYQTVAISANPVVAPITGLFRGFEQARSAPQFGAWYGPRLAPQARDALAKVDRSAGPVFLFVNISDAHTPWSDVPEGIDWLPPRKGMVYRASPGSSWVDYVNGDLTSEQVDELLPRYRDVYDWGIHRADRTLGALLEELELAGLREVGDRLIISSDHGEHLGGQNAVGHGCTTHEAVVRVPVVTAGIEVDLIEPMTATDLFFLARDGNMPSESTPVRSVAGPSRTWSSLSDWYGKDLWIADWRETEKRVWRSGEIELFDLKADPKAERGHRVQDSEIDDDLKAFVAGSLRSFERAPPSTGELDERLEALGYL